jgi:predicted nucleic acid-binding protein
VILVDTSVWVDHFREGVPPLAEALSGSIVLMHPFIIGELACGNIRNRDEVLRLLRELPPASTSTNDEALSFIHQRSLMSRGIGYIDVHLLASAVLSGATLWTSDKRLAGVPRSWD